MSSVIEVKVRHVGNSLGVIFPKRLVSHQGIKAGQSVKLSVIPSGTGGIESLFGIAKGAKPFVRDDCCK